MIKRIFLIVTLVSIIQLISGCIDICNCPKQKKINYTNKDLSLINIDSSMPQAMITNSAKISTTNFGIRVNLITEQVALIKPKIHWGLIQTAYACSCAEDEYISKEDFVALEIFSNNDFDINHPKNTDLSPYFKVKRGVPLVSVSEYISYLKSNEYYRKFAFNEGVFLQVAPTLSKKHKFRFRITLSDGRVLEAEAPEVELI